MPEVCRDVTEWIETRVERPIDTWATNLRSSCSRLAWWNPFSWFCWIFYVLVRIVVFIVVTVGKWVTRAVCEIVAAALVLVGTVLNLILSIPIIGGFLRTVINWLVDIGWRVLNLGEMVLGWYGVTPPRRRIYIRLLILERGGEGGSYVPLTTESAVLPSIQQAQDIFLNQCNVRLIYQGSCSPGMPAPASALTIGCDTGGFFQDWWLSGSFLEFAAGRCFPEGNFTRSVGLGAEIVIVVIDSVVPEAANLGGCSLSSGTNYVVVENSRSGFGLIAHEIGHACGLWHLEDPRTS
jgi:hypothetical protein